MTPIPRSAPLWLISCNSLTAWPENQAAPSPPAPQTRLALRRQLRKPDWPDDDLPHLVGWCSRRRQPGQRHRSLRALRLLSAQLR